MPTSSFSWRSGLHIIHAVLFCKYCGVIHCCAGVLDDGGPAPAHHLYDSHGRISVCLVGHSVITILQVGLPLLGLMPTSQVAMNYLNSTNYMFLGGLIMAIAVEHCGLHNRVALKIIMMVGTSQARLMLGFMFTTMVSIYKF